MSNENYDTRAEDLVLIYLKIIGHHYSMKADSSTNPNWDIIDFVPSDNGQYPSSFTTHYYQVKAHDFNATSQTINANFPKLKQEKKVEFLYIVIFNHGNIPEIYRFNLVDEVKEKSDDSELFDENGNILYSKENKERKDDNRTISLTTFYEDKYKSFRDNHLLQWK